EETGDTVTSFTIITTDANEKLEPVHDRMPVILSPEEYDAWLDPENNDPDQLVELLGPSSSDAVDLHPVSTAVNNPGYDEPGCTEPVDADEN
ncbi:MAG: SOS response-associated peptidase, partial [bacterium]